mmetsp:Transcript_10918/g.40717  ORF Transcript_10918/g.40717 Transcript_10918/m.40717 type:complete len:112 (+) Transcript_10918:1025-1360(+)
MVLHQSIQFARVAYSVVSVVFAIGTNLVYLFCGGSHSVHSGQMFRHLCLGVEFSDEKQACFFRWSPFHSNLRSEQEMNELAKFVEMMRMTISLKFEKKGVSDCGKLLFKTL